MIASHEKITAMATHAGLRVEIRKREDRPGLGSQYTFIGGTSGKKLATMRTPREAIAWLLGYGTTED